MAKNAKQSTQSTQSAVQVCAVAIVATLLTQAKQAERNTKEGASRSKQVIAAIAALFASFVDDAEGYLAAVVEVFGNGVKGKDNTAGLVGAELKAKEVSALTVKSTLYHARTVALNWAKADVVKAATESGLRKAYDATKAPKADTPKAETPKGTVVSDVEMLRMLCERNTHGGVLAMLESLLSASADPIRAAAVRECRSKFPKVAA